MCLMQRELLVQSTFLGKSTLVVQSAHLMQSELKTHKTCSQYTQHTHKHMQEHTHTQNIH